MSQKLLTAETIKLSHPPYAKQLVPLIKCLLLLMDERHCTRATIEGVGSARLFPARDRLMIDLDPTVFRWDALEDEVRRLAGEPVGKDSQSFSRK